MRRLALCLLLAVCVFAASPTPISRGGHALMPSGNAFYSGPWEIYYQAVPTSLTDVCSIVGTCKDSHIISVVFVNTTGSAITITFQTKDASPLALPLSGSLAANTTVSLNIPAGLLSKGGFSVQAGATGAMYHVVFTN